MRADAEVAQAEVDLAAGSAVVDALRRRLVATAVSSFVSPEDSALSLVLEADDVASVGRRQALLDHVVARDADVIDQLRVAEDDHEGVRDKAASARETAEARQDEVVRRLDDLEASVAAHHTMAVALEARRAEVLVEIEALVGSKAELDALIASRVRVSSADASGAGGCVWPARGPVTSEYGSRWGRLHAGLDVAAPTGTPIWAAKAGKVIVAGRQSGYGRTVVIDHGGGMTTLYAHQSRLVARRGQWVSQGQLIGYIGNSGQSTGAHLHFETHYSGSARNPRSCLR